MKKQEKSAGKPISQKLLAEYLNLSPSTISLVMNGAPRGMLISEETRNRIFEAARKFDYRPDFYARYMASRRSYTVAILLSEIREAFAARLVSGIDHELVAQKYLYFCANHHGDETVVNEYARRLIERAVEGFVFINTVMREDLGKPVVCIGSQPQPAGVGRVTLNNEEGGRLAVEHLASLGHTEIAVIKGHPWRAASEQRWAGIAKGAKAAGIKLREKLIVQLRSDNTGRKLSAPEEGYRDAQALLRAKTPFTALIAFNDVTAIGAIKAFREAGLNVPHDVSVVGFDDIEGADYVHPSLTTLRQPFEHMGKLAARQLLERIADPSLPPESVEVNPELILRESTAAPPSMGRASEARAQRR